MKHLLFTIFPLFTILLGCKHSKVEKITELPENVVQAKPKVSFTFDDGITSDLAGFKFELWNQMILTHLKKENLKSVFFVTGKNKSDAQGQFLLESWDNQGHLLANHSYSHPNFNSEENSTQLFEKQLLKTDLIISKFNSYTKLFRFPYLKEGQNKTKVDSIRLVLNKHDYSNGYVTIDASDWYVNHRLINRIKEAGLENAGIKNYKDFYLQHILERANYYEKLSLELTNRHINHTLLLHHNLSSALFLGDLIKEFKEQGWEVVNADKAFKDPIFQNIPKSDFAGESLIYSLAKQSGKYTDLLRYPAEDSRYEKNKMEELGL